MSLKQYALGGAKIGRSGHATDIFVEQLQDLVTCFGNRELSIVLDSRKAAFPSPCPHFGKGVYAAASRTPQTAPSI